MQSNARSPIAALMLMLATAVAGCMMAPNDAEPGGSTGTADADVAMRDLAFTPAVVTVPVGATVRWTNHESIGHTVTTTDEGLWGSRGSGDAPADWLGKDDSWSHTFDAPGTYEYFCLPHAFAGDDGKYVGMTGKIVVSGAPPSDVTALVVPDPRAPAPTGRNTPARVQLELESREVVAQLADGVAYEFWTFNGTVPGPMLRVREGDTVDFTLRNAADSKHPHSIDLHAVTGPGGGAKATQTAPGAASSFSFQALNPGLYVYHCATAHIPTHVANGMYGLIFVEPETDWRPVDREYFVVQGEIYTAGALGDTGLQAFSAAKMMSEDPEYFLLNGRVGALTGTGALEAQVNDTVRIYFGVGGFVPSSFHVIGEIFDTVWEEAGMSAPARDIQTTLVPAGGAAIVEFKVEVPGDYLLVDHWLTHAIDRGAVGVLHVEGPPNDAVFSGPTDGGAGH